MAYDELTKEEPQRPRLISEVQIQKDDIIIKDRFIQPKGALRYSTTKYRRKNVVLYPLSGIRCVGGQTLSKGDY